jgi:hypothetical protein
MQVRIYRPCKTAMQSGRAKTCTWVLEYELETPRRPDPLMGWASSADTNTQVKLKFATVEEATAYAQKQGWAYTVQPAHDRTLKPRNYVDNFKYKAPPAPKADSDDQKQPAKKAPRASAKKSTTA